MQQYIDAHTQFKSFGCGFWIKLNFFFKELNEDLGALEGKVDSLEEAVKSLLPPANNP